MNDLHKKPKLVLFQQRYYQHSAEFILLQQREHVRCLSQFFDVTVIHEDCDYQEICERYEPELTVFESGVNLPNCERSEIRNTHVCSEIPKIGFLNADAWSDSRSGILSDMEHWGIETFFSICVTAAEHMPMIAENLFVWPNFIDSEIYRDYGESKNIPVLFTGCQNEAYPWRYRIYKILSEYYPSLVCPHFGYRSRTRVNQTLWGEQYARTINASWFAPTCGTFAKEIVRKHFEIPGSKACLVTERSPGLESAGFIDMKNCVFADDRNVIDKLSFLFEHPDELNEIITSGYELVHSRHTMKHRDQIFQWFNLKRNLLPYQKIVQIDPFLPLAVVEKSSGIRNTHIISNGLHLLLLREGNDLIQARKYDEAERSYLKCAHHAGVMAEPLLGIALCNLFKGNARVALSWIIRPLRYTLSDYKAIDPDPIEWSYFIICLICMGKLNHALKRSNQFQWLHHPELDRTRWVINVLTNKKHSPPFPQDDCQKHHLSIHQIPNLSFTEWMDQLCLMLKACRQFTMVETLTNLLSTEGLSNQTGLRKLGINARMLEEQEKSEGQGVLPNLPLFLRKNVTLRYLDNPLLFSRVKIRLSDLVLDLLRWFEAKFGYFLPYHVSNMRNDAFFAAIRKLMKEEEIKTAIVIGAVPGKGSTEAFLAGSIENENKPCVFCITVSNRQYSGSKRKSTSDIGVKWYELPSYPSEKLTEEIDKAVRKIKKENRITIFDAVLINSSRLRLQSYGSVALKKDIHQAKLVLLDNTNTSWSYDNLDDLLHDPNYIIVARNPDFHDGYAIFKRKDNNKH